MIEVEEKNLKIRTLVEVLYATRNDFPPEKLPSREQELRNATITKLLQIVRDF